MEASDCMVTFTAALLAFPSHGYPEYSPKLNRYCYSPRKPVFHGCFLSHSSNSNGMHVSAWQGTSAPNCSNIQCQLKEHLSAETLTVELIRGWRAQLLQTSLQNSSCRSEYLQHSRCLADLICLQDAMEPEHFCRKCGQDREAGRDLCDTCSKQTSAGQVSGDGSSHPLQEEGDCGGCCAEHAGSAGCTCWVQTEQLPSTFVNYLLQPDPTPVPPCPDDERLGEQRTSLRAVRPSEPPSQDAVTAAPPAQAAHEDDDDDADSGFRSGDSAYITAPAQHSIERDCKCTVNCFKIAA